MEKRVGKQSFKEGKETGQDPLKSQKAERPNWEFRAISTGMGLEF